MFLGLYNLFIFEFFHSSLALATCTPCGGAKKRSAASSTSSGYGRVSTGSAGSMSAPGLRSGKLEVRKEKSERNERTGVEACQNISLGFCQMGHDRNCIEKCCAVD